MFKHPSCLGQLHPPVVLEEPGPKGAHTLATVRHRTPTSDSHQSSNGRKEQARVRQRDGRASPGCELLEVMKRWISTC